MNRINRTTLVCVALLIAASFVPILAASRLAHPIDDAYITMTYARSISEGRGFTFGASDHPTLGTTTPLNALVLAALFRLLPQADAAGVAVALSVAAWIATGWLWWLGGGLLRLNRLERLFIALLVLIETTLWIQHLGMETWQFVCLLTLCVMLYFRGNMLATGILIGLLFLTRGEGILLGGLIGLRLLWGRDWRGILRFAAGGAVILLPWALYATLTFGSPLPSTLAAKTAQMQIGFTQPFIVYMAYVFVGEWTNLGTFVVSPWLFLFVGGLVYAIRARRRMLLFPAWALLFLAAYGILNVPTYKWYALPVMYVVTILSALALAGIAPLVARLSRGASGGAQRIGTAAALAAFALVVAIILPRNIPAAPVGDWRHDVYRQLATYIEGTTDAGSSVAYVEVGVLAWYGDRPLIDLLGLTSPELLLEIRRADFPAAIAHADPDILICASLFDWACRDTVSRADFAERYQQIGAWSGAELGAPQIADEQFVIYAKKG